MRSDGMLAYGGGTTRSDGMLACGGGTMRSDGILACCGGILACGGGTMRSDGMLACSDGTCSDGILTLAEKELEGVRACHVCSTGFVLVFINSYVFIMLSYVHFPSFSSPKIFKISDDVCGVSWG
jgi:hypothetical protein